MKFKNRNDAAVQLAPLLRKYASKKSVVLAIPRGAVPIGYYISKALNVPFDILLSKKLGHPFNPELAIGSVSLEGRVIDPQFKIDENYIDKETIRLRAALKESSTKFFGNRAAVDLSDKTVIIVDDGIATGNTMLASIDLVSRQFPNKIIVAAPVASKTAIEKLKQKVDDVVCIQIPQDFRAVGQFYKDFSEVTDEQVIQFLNEAITNEDKLSESIS